MSLLHLCKSSRNFQLAVRHTGLVSIGPPSCLLTSPDLGHLKTQQQLSNILHHIHHDHRRHYSSSSSAKSSASRWFVRRVYAALALLGVTGGALMLVSGRLASSN